MSQTDHKETTIDGVRYRMRPLPPMVAMHLLRRFFQILGPSLGATVDSLGGNLSEILNSQKDIKIGSVIGGAVERLSGDDLDWAISTLSKQCDVVKGPNETPRLADIFDVHFQGRVRHLFAWLTWAAKGQFADFFDEWAENAQPPE
jgi:hypothetical protein